MAQTDKAKLAQVVRDLCDEIAGITVDGNTVTPQDAPSMLAYVLSRSLTRADIVEAVIFALRQRVPWWDRLDEYLES
jgi:hypothetical protein